MPVIKKIIYIVGITMFLSLPLSPWQGYAATDENAAASCNVIKDPGCRLSSRIEYALRKKDNKGLDFGQSFGTSDPKKIGRDLYLTIYKNTQADTMDEAVIATAAQYGLPPERMVLILGGDIRPLMDRSPSMRIEDIVKIYNQMVATYHDRKNSADLKAVIGAKILSNEIFADGDLSNSGFDLINDLNNIETILFNRHDLVSFGGSLVGSENKGNKRNGGNGKNSKNTVSQNTPDIPVDLNGLNFSSEKSNSTSQVNVPFKSHKTTNSNFMNPFSNFVEDKSSLLNGQGINPNQCFSVTKIDDALNKFAASASENSKFKSAFYVTNEEGDPGSIAHKDDNSNKEPSNTKKNCNANEDENTCKNDVIGSNLNIPVNTSPNHINSAKPVEPAPPGDYSTPDLCDNIICMSIDFIKKPAKPSFDKIDNCIQCHVQYINENMKKTIAHNLIPAKATGNFGESSLCKNAASVALGSVGMNINVNLIPAVTPSKDDLVTLGNISDEWDKYAEKNGAWNYWVKKSRKIQAEKIGRPVDSSPPQSDLTRMLTIELVNATDNSSQINVTDKAVEALEANKSAQSKELLMLEISKEAYESVDTFKALDDEMKVMNKYFDGFKNLFQSLSEDVLGMNSSKSCTKLKSKKACV